MLGRKNIKYPHESLDFADVQAIRTHGLAAISMLCAVSEEGKAQSMHNVLIQHKLARDWLMMKSQRGRPQVMAILHQQRFMVLVGTGEVTMSVKQEAILSCYSLLF